MEWSLASAISRVSIRKQRAHSLTHTHPTPVYITFHPTHHLVMVVLALLYTRVAPHHPRQQGSQEYTEEERKKNTKKSSGGTTDYHPVAAIHNNTIKHNWEPNTFTIRLLKKERNLFAIETEGRGKPASVAVYSALTCKCIIYYISER